VRPFIPLRSNMIANEHLNSPQSAHKMGRDAVWKRVHPDSCAYPEATSRPIPLPPV